MQVYGGKSLLRRMWPLHNYPQWPFMRAGGVRVMTGTTQYVCYICNKPVNLEQSKTDENGRAIHEECYVAATLLRTGSHPAVATNPKVQTYKPR